MTPCMRLYAWLGQQLRAAHPDHAHAYSPWIATYASDDFDALAARLETLLDRTAREAPEEGLFSVYRQALELELAFLEAVYAGIPS